MSGVNVQLNLNLGQLRSNVFELPEKIDRLTGAVMQRQVSVSEGYMRTNAPWTDRTANARNGLFASAGKSGNTHVLTLAHSVPYGIWLEVRFGGRFAIIVKSVQAGGADVMRLLEKGMARL